VESVVQIGDGAAPFSVLTLFLEVDMAAQSLDNVKLIRTFFLNLGEEKQHNDLDVIAVSHALDAIIIDQAALKAALVVADADLDAIAAIVSNLGDATAAATAAAVKTTAAIAASTARIV
jgi:hypothetical protein